MEETASSAASDSQKKPIGMHVTSDPDRTAVEAPATYGARERPDLPFRILLVSDLTPQAPAPDDWAQGTYVHRVDKNRFAGFMQEMAPRLEIDVPNALDDTPKTWTVPLQFSALDDFRPDRLARQIPALDQLMDVRALVEAVGAGELDRAAFRERLDALGIDVDWSGEMYRMLTGEEAPAEPSPPAASSAEKDEAIDRLLGMVDGGDDAGATGAGGPSSNGDVGASGFVDALMDAVSGEREDAGVEASAVKRLLAQLDAVIGRQVEQVVAHPAVRRLEAAWRGLKFLVDRLNFRKDVQLMVLPVGREALAEAMHHQVLLPEHDDEREEPPLSLILVDMAFGRGQRDVEQLADLAATGESLQTPIVAAAGDAFFGVERISGLAKLPALRPHLQGPEYVAWKALRQEEDAQFLALALPAFLLRAPYGPDRPAEPFEVEEAEGLWGSGALAVGVAAARSFTETGWPTHLTDYPIDDLPIQPGRGGHSPLAALLPGSKQSELARAGFVVLGGKPDHDAVRIVHAPMVQKPETYDDPVAASEARVHASLPCRLFVARAAHYLLALQDGLAPGTPVEAAQAEVEGAMRAFLGVPAEAAEDEDPHVTVDHVTTVDLPEHELLAVRLRPPSSVLKPTVRLVMGLQVEHAVSPENEDA